MVMGPTCGLVLADLGAEVIKVEPLEGDNTRRLQAAGAGFFPMFNRNKKSLAVDLKSTTGMRGRAETDRERGRRDGELPARRTGQAGLGYAELSKKHPRLVYCSLKGFLDGPYEHRPALDEVVQMMGGLAYMTGLPDRPLRAGSSVVDIMGGMFAAVGILAALRERESTGRGKLRDAARCSRTRRSWSRSTWPQFGMTGEAPPPMSVKRPAWGVYDIFVRPRTATGFSSAW